MARTAGKKKGSSVEVGERFVRDLPCPINKQTADRKRDEVLKVLDDIDEQNALMKPFRMRIAELHEQKRELRESIHSMTEKRPVKCMEERDYRKREIRVIRIDTRAVVESRPMTDDDRQEELEDLSPPTKRLKNLAKEEGEKRDQAEVAAEKPKKGRAKLKAVPPTPAEAIAKARAEDNDSGLDQDEERVRRERDENEDEADDQL